MPIPASAMTNTPIFSHRRLLWNSDPLISDPSNTTMRKNEMISSSKFSQETWIDLGFPVGAPPSSAFRPASNTSITTTIGGISKK